jgi:uncharacterized protein (DUF433 family)
VITTDSQLLLEQLAAALSREQVLEGFPELEDADISRCDWKSWRIHAPREVPIESALP